MVGRLVVDEMHMRFYGARVACGILQEEVEATLFLSCPTVEMHAMHGHAREQDDSWTACDVEHERAYVCV